MIPSGDSYFEHMSPLHQLVTYSAVDWTGLYAVKRTFSYFLMRSREVYRSFPAAATVGRGIGRLVTYNARVGLAPPVAILFGQLVLPVLSDDELAEFAKECRDEYDRYHKGYSIAAGLILGAGIARVIYRHQVPSFKFVTGGAATGLALEFLTRWLCIAGGVFDPDSTAPKEVPAPGRQRVELVEGQDVHQSGGIRL